MVFAYNAPSNHYLGGTHETNLAQENHQHCHEGSCIFRNQGISPTSLATGKEPKRKVSYLTKPALKAVMAQPDPQTPKGMRNRFIMIMLYDTGARIQELLYITVKDLDLEVETGGPGKQPR